MKNRASLSGHWMVLGTYVLFGVLWIFLSDWILALWTEDALRLTRWQNIKGWLFVAASALLLHVLLRGRQRAEAAQQTSEMRVRALLDHLPQKILLKDKHLRYVTCNRNYARDFHLLPDEVVGKTDVDFFPKPVADKHHAEDRAVLESGKTLDLDERRLQQGRERLYHTTKTPVRDAEGQISGVLCVFWDLTEWRRAEEELRRTNRALRTLSTCSQALVRAESEAELLKAICEILVEQGGYLMTWVGYAQHDEAKTVRPMAQAGFEEGYLATLQITWADTERGRGPTGMAIRTGEHFVVQNILTEPFYAPWRTEAAKRGYASSIALPLRTDGTVLGALNIYAAMPDAFDPQELALLIQLAEDLAFGIVAMRARGQRQEAEAALRDSEARLRAIFAGITDVILVLDHDGRYLEVAPTAPELLYKPARELLGKTLHQVFPAPQADTFLQGLRQALHTRQPVNLEYPLVIGEKALWFAATISPMAENRVVWVARNITDRRPAEAAPLRVELGAQPLPNQ